MDNISSIIPGTYAIFRSSFGYSTIVYIESADSQGFTVSHIVNLNGYCPPDPSFIPHSLVTTGQLKSLGRKYDPEMIKLLYDSK